jgi:ribosomal protein S18 acetylase RimI-like enzyme
VSVRRAGPDDLPVLEGLWRAFLAEVPEPPHVDVDLESELREIREIAELGLAFLAEQDVEPVGLALARRTGPRVARITDLYVVPTARRDGVAAALVRELLATLDGEVDAIDLEVAATNTGARGVYQRWGFREDAIVMVAPVDQLRRRLATDHTGASFGSVHVQTDDRAWVERTMEEFARRIGSPGSRVEGPRNGWTAVYDPVADADPHVLLRVARELSERLGAVVLAVAVELDQVVRLVALERGGIVDEYLSVPEFHGPLPPGDVVGLSANPTVLARLTGADPAAVKAVARTAAAADELPPARELLAAIAAVLGLEGTGHGFEVAP